MSAWLDQSKVIGENRYSLRGTEQLQTPPRQDNGQASREADLVNTGQSRSLPDSQQKEAERAIRDAEAKKKAAQNKKQRRGKRR